jgi:hypothetical protein
MQRTSVFLGALVVFLLAAPNAALAIQCGPGFVPVCDTGPNGKPVCHCERPDPIPITGVVIPTFYITHVVYAVPGLSSSVAYVNGSTFGSTVTLDNSFTSDEKVTVSNSGGIFVGGDITVSTGSSFGNTSSNSTDVSIRETHTYTKFGQDDFVNHDDDEIWFLVHPRLDVSFSDSTAKNMTWSFSANQQLQPYFVYVGELKNPSLMPPAVKTFLDSAGITSAYYAQLLKADPFANGDIAIDPSRYQLPPNNIFPYEPPLEAGDKPSTQVAALLRDTTNRSTDKRTTSYSVGFSVSAGVSFFSLFSSKVTVANTLTFAMSTSTTLASTTTVGETITIGQPLFGYNGPTVLRAYVDKIWKTYLFKLDYQ